MTLHEIEETVHLLASRHKELDEVLLVTLLRAGGWEEKDIAEGKLIYRTLSRNALIGSPAKTSPLIGSTQSLPELPSEVDVEHRISEHVVSEKAANSTPVSLVPDHKLNPGSREELPHNLPLRPFETSEHIWPFSRYKDVFFGDAPEPEVKEIQPQPKKVVQESAPAIEAITPQVEVKKEEPVMIPVPVKVVETKIIEVPVPQAPTVPPVQVFVRNVPTPPSKGDDKLVITAVAMLVVILLLLGYMYSNGRL